MLGNSIFWKKLESNEMFQIAVLYAALTVERCSLIAASACVCKLCN